MPESAMAFLSAAIALIICAMAAFRHDSEFRLIWLFFSGFFTGWAVLLFARCVGA